jgi:hypothetical protein
MTTKEEEVKREIRKVGSENKREERNAEKEIQGKFGR